MESVLTVRLDAHIKEQGAAVMKQQGISPSQAVRKLFDYAVIHDALPFSELEKPHGDDMRERIAAFDRCHTKRPLALSDDELREARLRERYELDA